MTQKPIVPAFAICAAAAAVAILACLAAGQINRIYYSNHPFIGDTSSFFYNQIKLYMDSLVRPKNAVIWDVFTTNSKNPLAYLHYLAFPRTFLLSMNSHLVFTGIAFGIFSALLGWAVYQRTGSAIYGIASPFLIFCAEGLFNPMYQVPSKLADPPAAFVFGAAVLCVVNSSQARSLPWLGAFGLFAGLTLLSRFTASGYLFIVCAPVLLLYFWLRFRDPGYGTKHVAWSILAIATPLVAVAGWHFVTHIGPVTNFYRIAGYALNQGPWAAIETTLFGFSVHFLGGLGFALPILIAGLYAAVFWSWRKNIIEFWVTIWIAIAVPITIILVLQVHDDWPQLAFGLAGFMLLALAPFPINFPSDQMRRLFNRFALAVAIALVPVTAHAMLRRPYAVYVNSVSAMDAQLAAANRKMAEYAFTRHVAQMREQVIDASFDYHWRHLQPTSLYAFGTLPRTERQFDIRKEQWLLSYPGMEPPAIIALLSKSYNEKTDVLYLLAEPSTERARVLTKDDFTTQIAQGVLDWVRNAPGWTKLGTVEIPWGPVEVWQNGNRR